MQEPCYTHQPAQLFRQLGKAWELHKCVMHRLAGLLQNMALGRQLQSWKTCFYAKPCCMQMSEVVRLGGQHSDADGCGMLVWAQTDGSLWWPAEALDPFHLPPARSLPPAALAGQNPANMTSHSSVAS